MRTPSSSRWGPLGGSPYFFLGRRPFREARLRAYLVREHRSGRPLSSILDDPYVRRCGSREFCARVANQPETIAALHVDVVDAIASSRP
jgi:hypothetical protein